MNKNVRAVVGYLRHLLGVQSKYKIHSPFVYDFYQNILNNGQEYPQYRLMDKVRREFVTQSRFIKRKDLGSGAGDVPGDQRFVRVRDVVRHSCISRSKGEFLFRLTRYVNPKSIIELGTSLGISTMYLSLAAPDSQIQSIEGCLDSANIARANFDHYGLRNITVITGNFEDKLDKVLTTLSTVDLVFFDGNHRKEPTLSYFEKCLQHIHPGSVFIFDDIHWSGGMEEAWKTICRDPRVKVTIDIFHMGVVFFRNELSKENFRLRF